MYGLPETVVLNNFNYKIKSPEGYVPFLGVNKIKKDRYIHLKFSNGVEIKCSEDHPFDTIDGIIAAKILDKKTEVKTETSGCFVISKRNIKRKIDLYDIVNSGTQHLYYSNGIVSHNCHFLGSSNTLIDAKKLQQLTWKEPLHKFEDLDIYEEPIPGHRYFMTVDVSRGVSIDYSAFVVFDVTNIPYRVVAKYRNNEIAPLLYPNIIWRAGKHYNEALVLIEINDNGQQISDILFYDLEYEGVVLTQVKGRAGVSMGGTHKVRPIRGIRQTKQTKRIGCANLKNIIESDKLVFHDYDIIYELFRFIENRSSYEAEQGEHDDLVMCLVMFGWAVAQKYFIGQTETDVRSDLWEENKDLIEQSVTPFGILTDNWNMPNESVGSIDSFYNMDFHPDGYYQDEYENPAIGLTGHRF